MIADWLHSAHRRRLVGHFQGMLSPAEETRLRDHLRGCDRCRAGYLALSLAEEKQGEEAAKSRHARLEQGLFGSEPSSESAPQSMPKLLWGLGGLGAVAAAATVLFMLVPAGSPPPEFREKGASSTLKNPADDVAVYVYQPGEDGAGYRRIERQVVGTRPLAFAYSNLAARRYDRIMIFGVDERFTVYWYYPSWNDPKTDPSAEAIRRGRGVELGQQVSHDYQGKTLRLFALFSQRRDLTVRSIERAVSRAQRSGKTIAALERLPVKEAVSWTQLFQVVAR